MYAHLLEKNSTVSEVTSYKRDRCHIFYLLFSLLQFSLSKKKSLK